MKRELKHLDCEKRERVERGRLKRDYLIRIETESFSSNLYDFIEVLVFCFKLTTIIKTKFGRRSCGEEASKCNQMVQIQTFEIGDQQLFSS